jgi:predicted HTH transcriptional regulator
MDKAERIRACYQHACLKWLSSDRMSNESLRQRLKLDKADTPVASKIIRDTTRAGLIRPAETGSNSSRHRRYVPFWA